MSITNLETASPYLFTRLSCVVITS